MFPIINKGHGRKLFFLAALWFAFPRDDVWVTDSVLGVCLAATVRPRVAYTLSDLAATFSASLHNAPMIDATRIWRHGLRTHIVLDQSLDVRTLEILGAPQGETFTVLPNFSRPGTLRHTMAPLFAFEALGGSGGGLKWLLVGDADTVFVPRTVLQLLNDLGLSADEPHMLSDFLVDCDYKICTPGTKCPVCTAGLRVDPRCLPCNNTSTASGRLCTCRLPEECSRPRKALNDTDPMKDCAVPTEISAYGGAGIIYSVGLLRELTADPWFYAPEALKALVHQRPYSDVALAEVVRLKGFGFTRLPLLPPPKGVGYRGNNDRRFSSYSLYNDKRQPREQLAGLLGVERKSSDALNSLVSYHVHALHGPEFATVTLQPYLALARLLTRRPHGKQGDSSSDLRRRR